MIRLSVNFPFRKKCVSAGLRGGGGKIVRRQRMTADTDEYESRSEGRSASGGECCPSGQEQLTGGRRGQSFVSGMKAAQRGVYSVPRGKCRPSGHERSAQASFCVRDETVHGRRRRQMAAVSTSFCVWDENRSERRSLGF